MYGLDDTNLHLRDTLRWMLKINYGMNLPHNSTFQITIVVKLGKQLIIHGRHIAPGPCVRVTYARKRR